jgi:folate-binding protein YgfZ
MPALLGPAELLMLTGVDAQSFAHTQFTSDVRSLAVGRWQWSAWLDAQGRVRHFFALLHIAPSSLVAWLPLGGAGLMHAALSRFILRAKVKLEVRIGSLHALDATERPVVTDARAVAGHDGGYAIVQPGTPDRMAWFAPSHDGVPTVEPLRRWRLADVEAGLPFLIPELSGEFVPQALELERLDAIRFDKGCYPGQEIAARLHFRGGNKRGLRRLQVMGKTPPSPGAGIVDASRQPIGRVLHAASTGDGTNIALAVVALDSPVESAFPGPDGVLVANMP